MKDKGIYLPSTGFPSQFVSDEEKASKEFGLLIGQSIQYEWFKQDGSSCRFYDRRREFHKRRLYARGEQSVGKYKNELAIDGDLSYLNLDWTPVPIIPKFVDIVVNGMSDRLFTVKAYAQDAMSQAKRSKYQDMIEGQMVAKPILDTIMEKTGANPYVVDPEGLPNSDEELSLYMQLNYKPAIEIAEEEAINTILAENHYYDIRKRIDRDQTEIGIGIAKHSFQKGSGAVLNYVDPADAIWSYTEDPNFRDCFYWGEVKTVPVIELKKEDPSLTTEELKEISEIGQGWLGSYNTSQREQDDVFYKDTCTVIYFNYKTLKNVVYKKKILDDNGNSKFIEKDDNFNPPQEILDEGRFEKVSKTIEVWYEGIMIAGSNKLLKWEMSKNMVRPKSASQHALPNYVACAPRMYKGVITSLVERMIPFADLLQITHLKLQQVIARTVPDGVFIDADGLNEVELGNGLAYNPQEALKLYFQTGSVVGRSSTEEGEFNHGKVPIQQLTSNSGASKTQMLITNYNHYLDQIRNVTGLNEARDGSTPSPHALVGVQKLAALNSNTATRHILDAGLSIFQGISEALTYRIADILEYADFKDEFANQIGKYNVSILNEIKDLYLYDFGIFIEISPDEEQKAALEENIKLAQANQNIDIEDAIDIREIKNIKLANQLLKLKRKKKQEREEQMEMQRQAMQAQQNQQSQAMAAESKMQALQMETNSKIQIKQAEVAFDIELQNNEARLKEVLMQREFEMNMQLKGIDVSTLEKRETMKEDRKDKRVSQQSTEQSKLIDQRQNGLPPVNFESNEDSLDGFDLAEFDPR